MIRYGIIGTGRMGKNHAGVIAEIPEAQVTAAYDIDPAALDMFCSEYQATRCSSARELAAHPEVDCVIITSPTYCHQEGLEAAVAANKPIFCEKALCRTAEAAKEITGLLKNYPKLFTVGFVRRHMPKSVLVKKLLAEGLIGQIRFCNVELPLGLFRRMPGDWFADFQLSGGVMVDMLAHHVDLANWFFGDAKTVYAQGVMLDPAQPRPADYTSAIMTYENNVICNMTCTWARSGRTGELMEIYGDKGYLAITGEDQVTYCPLEGESVKLDPETELGKKNAAVEKDLNEVNFGNSFQLEFQHLTDALNGKDAALPSLQDALNSLQISLAMIDSAKTGKVITL